MRYASYVIALGIFGLGLLLGSTLIPHAAAAPVSTPAPAGGGMGWVGANAGQTTPAIAPAPPVARDWFTIDGGEGVDAGMPDDVTPMPMPRGEPGMMPSYPGMGMEMPQRWQIQVVKASEKDTLTILLDTATGDTFLLFPEKGHDLPLVWKKIDRAE